MHIRSKDFQNAQPVYDKAAIMRKAHEAARRLQESWSPLTYAQEFAGRLAHEWKMAKERALIASMNTTGRQAQAIRHEIDMLQNKSFHIDISARQQELESQLREIA